MRLLKDLKERRLIQWTLAYLAGAWLVLEVFSTLQQGLSWSPRLFPIVLGVLSVGFVVAVVLAWYHGEQGRQRVSGAELAIIAGLLLVAGLLAPRFSSPSGVTTDGAVIVGGGLEEGPAPAPEASGALSIAVLPFANLGDGEDQHFVDGIHDEVLHQLGKIHSVQVKSLTSVLEYRDSPKNLGAIGDELGARFIVNGSVQRPGERVRITARLQDARTGEQLWSDSYDRELTVESVLDVQREIALQIATSLGAEVLPEERAHLEVDAPANLAAYDSYLDGLFYYRSVIVSDIDWRRARQLAIHHLTESIGADPNWAPSRAALGGVYHWTSTRGEEPDEDFRLSKQWLDTALDIDPLFAPAWNSLGVVLSLGLGQLTESETAYERGFALGYRDPHGYALLLQMQGRFDEAVRQFERSTEFDPRSSAARANQGFAYLCVEDYVRAGEDMERARALGWSAPYWGLAAAYLRVGRTDEGFQELEALRGVGTVSNGMEAFLYALADSTDRAASRLLDADRGGDSISSLHVAAAVVLEDRERALDYLEQIALPRTTDMCFEEIRSLEGDARYDRFLDKIEALRTGGSRE